MKNNEFILAILTGDTNTPPLDYVPEILAVNTDKQWFKCRIVDSSDEFTFSYATGADSPWEGTNPNGVECELISHQVFTAGKIAVMALLRLMKSSFQDQSLISARSISCLHW